MNITNLKALTRKDLRRQAGNKPILEESIDVQSLPEEILDDLKTTPKSVLRAKLKKFAKDASKYEEGKSRSPVHTSGRETAEIYQEFQHVVENGGTEADMDKELDKDAKELTTKALRLSNSLQYPENDDEEEKNYFFPSEIVE
ncbi:hypothetical protein G6F57_005918 [Rhizopus arrhizus]|uniref:Uncharacterized protein n=1 Tax=Rhizopus oryzae TaxID=64495 RepID=A0A9P6X7T4_RHIOR|nr:hypothetical protein G6F23_004662 [Rhizopus arrhizus]KAG0759981.1 hypothetical protein G6F24_008662 [Rhizopus arrhizus]KAG0785708.1 hypothetical protein G6F22_007871 [Rhizopus arrhizus]KAG0786275.1 hypothetical protein G6F21_008703 [Rhizopus arrhizus]KAG0811727.1 hypothetical protein G6F20_006936 [Rhizopus arrhizus]